jgi:hypothetical protein
LAQQCARSTAQNEESARRFLVNQMPQQAEQLGLALNLVNHDKPAQPFECRQRLFQAGRIGGILSIKAVICLEQPCRRGLAALPGAGQRRHREGAQQPAHGGNIDITRDTAGIRFHSARLPQ